MDEELLQRQAPQSLEAEQAVLGSILIDSRCVADIIGILKPEDFFQKQNREIYESVYTMFNFSILCFSYCALVREHLTLPPRGSCHKKWLFATIFYD